MPIIRATTGEEIAFARRLRVGRSAGNELRIALRTVSGDHAVLELRDGGLHVRDLGSTNGTRLKGRRIHGWKRLDPGDEVRFGPDSAWKVVSVAGDGAADDGRPAVVVAESGRRYSVEEDRFVIGSSASADLRLEGCGLAAVATVLLREEGRTLRIPMGVDGDDSGRPLELVHGEEFSLGEVTLRYEDESAGEGGRTQAEHPRTRSYDLSLHLVPTAPGDGRIEVRSGGEVMEFDGVPNRFVLLLCLARAARGAEAAGGDPAGWVDDDRLRVGLWGKGGAAGRYDSALNKLVYDTRRMIAGRGLDPFFIEKRRGRTRLRIAPERIAIDGDV